MKARIAIAKEEFNKNKKSLFRSKLNIELRKISVRCLLDQFFIWLRILDTKKVRGELFGELWNVVLEENVEDKMIRESKKFLNI